MITRVDTAVMAKPVLLLCMMLLLALQTAFSQADESANKNRFVSGTITTTNNGISLLPTFTLGKPAAMFDFAMGNKKLTFEPYLRFALEGKPWNFIFWWRYKVLKTDKFQLGVGAHPALGFRTVTQTINGTTTSVITSQRYLGGEISPNYFIRKNISVGLYYLHSYGAEETSTRNTDFITINCNFSNLRLTDRYFLKFHPQLYYLKMDQRHGYYATAAITLARKNSPLAVQSILNKAIDSSIITKSDFVWNVSLLYSFRKNFSPVSVL
jgi:hypothetical protein